MEEQRNELVEVTEEGEVMDMDSEGLDLKSTAIGAGAVVVTGLVVKYVLKPAYGKLKDFKDRKKKEKYITVPKNKDEEEFEEESDE